MHAFQVNRKSEFFISVVKKGIHSSLLLGVMKNGMPWVLAKVGKSNLLDPHSEFEPCADSTNLKKFGLFCKKIAFKRTDAFLANEHYSTQAGSITYQSYSIEYEHYLEFLSLMAEIEKEQRFVYQYRAQKEHVENKMTYTDKGLAKLRHEGLLAYVPVSEMNGIVGFKYQNINAMQAQFKRRLPTDMVEAITKKALFLNRNNNCRHTATDILNAVLHFKAQVSSFFARSLNYQINLKDGQLEGNFYILPPPPSLLKNVHPLKRETLQKLYQRLESLPSKQAESMLTKEKFDHLKKLYLKMYHNPRRNLNQLLKDIHEYKHASFAEHHHRISKALGVQTQTEKLLREIKTDVKAQIDQENTRSGPK